MHKINTSFSNSGYRNAKRIRAAFFWNITQQVVVIYRETFRDNLFDSWQL